MSILDWIPKKIKDIVVPDKRTEKQKFMEAERERQKKLINDKIDEMMPSQSGILPFIVKFLIKSTGRSMMKDIKRIQDQCDKVRNLAEDKVIRDSRVKRKFGPDVQMSETVGLQSDSTMRRNMVENLEVVVTLDGSKCSGTVRIRAREDIAEGMELLSITISDGHNEFDISDVSLDADDEKTVIIDVKAKD